MLLKFGVAAINSAVENGNLGSLDNSTASDNTMSVRLKIYKPLLSGFTKPSEISLNQSADSLPLEIVESEQLISPPIVAARCTPVLRWCMLQHGGDFAVICVIGAGKLNHIGMCSIDVQ